MTRIWDVLNSFFIDQRAIWSISFIASANMIATVLGIVGSLLQAHFNEADDLGFLRKYSVIANYAIFLNLELFTILQREYPVLIGRGEHEQARHTAAIIQSWVLLTSGVVCSILSVVMLITMLQGHWREAAAWFIQIVTVFSILYVGYLTCTCRECEFTAIYSGGVGRILSPNYGGGVGFICVWRIGVFVVSGRMGNERYGMGNSGGANGF